MTATQSSQGLSGRTPREPIRARFPTCELCSWAARALLNGHFELKYLNRSCLEHREVVAVEDPGGKVTLL